ncbi:TonB family protein [Thermophagus sp. OGC60D27]|uniref:TonB family protein n=1 Tax=Thermophagus sp. OGC60D27 TaxID=3458415 RepID=UPI0040377AE2
MKKSLFFVLLIVLPALILTSFSMAQSVVVQSEVDKAPVFKGKPRQLDRFLEQYMSYPKEARIDLIEGMVEVSAIIADNGKLLEPQITKSVDALLDAEALRLVSLMQDWKPARIDGENVNCKVLIKVPFKLSEDTKMLIQTLHDHGLTEKMPLFVIDGKIVKEYIEVPHYNVKSVRVLKGEKAVQRFGEQAKNGVVIVTTKRGTPPVW